MMRLGFHYHVPAFLEDGKIYTHGGQGIFLDSLSPYCERILCFLHTPKKQEIPTCNYPIRSDNVFLISMGPHLSVPSRMILSHWMTLPVHRKVKELDVLLLRGPSPLLPAVASRAKHVPTVLLLVASYLRGIDSINQPAWRKILIRLWSQWNESQQLRIAQRCLTFTNSHQLYEDFKGKVPFLVETRTTTISQEDFFEREDTCSSPPYRILYTGRIAEEKGLLDILTAFSIVLQQGWNCYLDLVGMPESSAFFELFWKKVKNLGLEGRVRYIGFKPVGAELWEYYRQADLFMIASRSSEGFPRTLWEAMANCVPAIATRVGSIPFFLQHETHALLAQPNHPQELASLIQRVFQDKELRKRLIRNGYLLARQNTLEQRAKEMMDQIRCWMEEKKRCP